MAEGSPDLLTTEALWASTMGSVETAFLRDSRLRPAGGPAQATVSSTRRKDLSVPLRLKLAEANLLVSMRRNALSHLCARVPPARGSAGAAAS